MLRLGEVGANELDKRYPVWVLGTTMSALAQANGFQIRSVFL